MMTWYYKNLSGEAETRAACLLNIAICISEETPSLESDDCLAKAKHEVIHGDAGYGQADNEEET